MKNNTKEQALKLHKKLRGKIEVRSKAKVDPRALKLLYTPGVAAVSELLAQKPALTRQYTTKCNTVAVISDGSAVLGLGNIGPEGALPVMEGKALLFKEFGGVDAFPIVLQTQDTEEIIKTVKNIAPGFGGINLEDISAPRCFEIENRLKKDLAIPVMHDDQHGTAIVVLAGLINALKLAKKSMARISVVISGAGAAGQAIARLLMKAGTKNIIMLDSQGIIGPKRKNMDKYKKELVKRTNPRRLEGNLQDALKGADVFIGVSKAGLLNKNLVRLMANQPIIFAMANPTPEIMPDEAMAGGAFIVATGRSDFPNQINNVLAFPGIFRGALDHGVKSITDTMKLNAAKKIAGLVPSPNVNKIIPSVFDKKVMPAVAASVK